MDKIFTTLGLTIVIVSVIVGYTWHDGNIFLLWQPSEFLIIGGAALGAFIASSTPAFFKATLKTLVKDILSLPLEERIF